MEFHPVDAESAPPHPRSSHRRASPARRLPNLTRMEDFQQRRIDDQGLWLADEFGEDLPPQRFQEAPELPHPPVERGRVKPRHPRKQVREEPLSLTQEGALTFHPSELLE